VLKIRIRDTVSFSPLDLRWVKNKVDPDPNIWVKKYRTSIRIRDLESFLTLVPGSWIGKKILIRDKHPGSSTLVMTFLHKLLHFSRMVER
jgi:hypothetical protein